MTEECLRTAKADSFFDRVENWSRDFGLLVQLMHYQLAEALD